MKIAFTIWVIILFGQVNVASAEIYKRIDSKGRSHYSDSSVANYRSAGYQKSVKVSSRQNSNKLENIAKRLKKDRLKRESERTKSLSVRKKKQKKQKKLLAAADKRKKACSIARQKEDRAFRQRTQRQSLTNMRKALANYEQKREIRQVKCR